MVFPFVFFPKYQANVVLFTLGAPAAAASSSPAQESGFTFGFGSVVLENTKMYLFMSGGCGRRRLERAAAGSSDGKCFLIFLEVYCSDARP